MLKINFLPDSDRKDRLSSINKGLEEFRDIWDKDGERIVKAIEGISKLKFAESEVNAVVFESSLFSRSFPLSLTASYPKNRKLSLLTHELVHRLISGNYIRLDLKEGQNIVNEVHKVMDLILYDVWVELEGKEYADMVVKLECKYSITGVTKEIWKWVLSFSKEERASKFKTVVENSTPKKNS